MRELSLVVEAHLVIRGDELVTEDGMLGDKDEVESDRSSPADDLYGAFRANPSAGKVYRHVCKCCDHCVGRLCD